MSINTHTHTLICTCLLSMLLYEFFELLLRICFALCTIDGSTRPGDAMVLHHCNNGFNTAAINVTETMEAFRMFHACIARTLASLEMQWNLHGAGVCKDSQSATVCIQLFEYAAFFFSVLIQIFLHRHSVTC